MIFRRTQISQGVFSQRATNNRMMIFDFLQHITIFLVFYLLNALVPILICIISSRIEPWGLQYVAGIGFITAIQLGFIQASFTMVVAFLFLMKRYMREYELKGVPRNYQLSRKGDPSFYSTAFIIILIFSAVFVPLFIGSSWSYNRYAVNHINTVIGQVATYNYIYGMSGYIFFTGFNMLFILMVYEHNSKTLGIFLLLLSKTIILSIGAALALGPKNLNPYQAGGYLGLGLSVGCAVATILTGLIAFFTTPLKKTNFKKIPFEKFKYVFNGVLPPALSIVSIQVVKAFALLIMGYSIAQILYQPVPMYLQLTRTIWYNMMYMIPFMTYGLVDAIMYYGLQAHKAELRINQFVNISLSALGVSLIVQLLFAIGMYYTMQPLGNVYATINGKQPAQWLDTNNIDLKYMLMQMKKQVSWTEYAQLAYLANTNPAAAQQIIADKLTYGAAASGVAAAGPLHLSAYKAFVYLVFWTALYSFGQGLNNISFVMKKRYPNLIEAIGIIIIQIGVIGFCVGLGVDQQQGNVFPKMDAFTFPLFLGGLLSLAWFSFVLGMAIRKAYKQRKYSLLIEYTEQVIIFHIKKGWKKLKQEL